MSGPGDHESSSGPAGEGTPGAFPAIPGGEGGEAPDFNALLSQVGGMVSDMQAAQAEAAAKIVQGKAGGGAVIVELTAGLEARSVRIDPSVIDPQDADLLGDLVLAAVRDALEQAQQVQTQAMGGLDLGGAAGMLGF